MYEINDTFLVYQPVSCPTNHIHPVNTKLKIVDITENGYYVLQEDRWDLDKFRKEFGKVILDENEINISLLPI